MEVERLEIRSVLNPPRTAVDSVNRTGLNLVSYRNGLCGYGSVRPWSRSTLRVVTDLVNRESQFISENIVRLKGG